jgi:hypothetical protein
VEKISKVSTRHKPKSLLLKVERSLSGPRVLKVGDCLPRLVAAKSRSHKADIFLSLSLSDWSSLQANATALRTLLGKRGIWRIDLKHINLPF